MAEIIAVILTAAATTAGNDHSVSEITPVQAKIRRTAASTAGLTAGRSVTRTTTIPPSRGRPVGRPAAMTADVYVKHIAIREGQFPARVAAKTAKPRTSITTKPAATALCAPDLERHNTGSKVIYSNWRP